MMNHLLVVTLILSSLVAGFVVEGFQTTTGPRKSSLTNNNNNNHHNRHAPVRPTFRVTSNQNTRQGCELFGGFMDGVGNFMKRFTTKATCSHILMKGGAEAENKLEDLKAEIGNSPVKFAEAAAKYSACPSASKGGDLGEFGPGAMVKEFDEVVFKKEVGTVHGPIKTQFGYHLIYINDRRE
jgi:peptidyl-prolyl cis-trans isomerase C